MNKKFFGQSVEKLAKFVKTAFYVSRSTFWGNSNWKKIHFFNFFWYFFINFFIKGVKIAFCLSRGSLWTFSEKKFLKKFQIVGQSSRAYCYFFSARFSKRVYENVLKKINCFGNKILFINFFVLCDTSFCFFLAKILKHYFLNWFLEVQRKRFV